MPKFVIQEMLYSYPIEILDVPHRAMVRLRAMGVLRLEDLANLSDEDLLQIYHLGKKSLTEIKRKIDALNECACTHGSPPEELMECMKLRLSNSEGLIEQMVQAVVSEAKRRSVSYYLSQLPSRSVFVVAERIGMRRYQIRTLQELADMMSLTRERVRQLQNRTIEHLKSKLHNEGVLGEWEDILSWAASEPPPGEANFLDRLSRTEQIGQSTPTGFVILATHLIKDIDIPVLLRAYRDGKLNRIWARRKESKKTLI